MFIISSIYILKKKLNAILQVKETNQNWNVTNVLLATMFYNNSEPEPVDSLGVQDKCK